jgi:predicted phage tail component-like protein
MVKTKIDGQYIDDLITGFRTLGVDGREELDLDVVSSEIDTSDGGRYMRRRIKSRTLKVHFYLSDDTAAGFSAKFNALKNKLHSIKESQIIFSDDAGVYFTGTFRKLTLAYKGSEVTRGTIEIFCADPFKYAVSETVINAVNGQITAEYGGTYPAYPVLTAQSATHDCGFYSFSDQDGHLIQIGNPEEEDREEIPDDDYAYESIDANFGSSYEPYAPTWYPGDARLLYGYETGSIGFQSAPAYVYALPELPGGEPNTYFGPALGASTNKLPNFTCSFLHWFEPSGNQGGGFDIYFNNTGGGNICGVCIRRNKGDVIKAYLIVKGNVVKTTTYTLASNPFGGVWHTETISKYLGTVNFDVGGVTFSVTDPDLADRSYDIKNISFIIYKQPGADQIGANNALKNIQYRGYPNTSIDFHNIIPMRGLVEVDTGSGEISVNGDAQPDIGSIYNDFEGFKLAAGENTIACSSSGWVDDAVYTMRYKEVYL